MIEQNIKIPLSEEGLFIYGTLRGGYDRPMIILCHGYGGWQHETLLYNGARYFDEVGYSTLRLSMYGGGENSRDINKSDVITHASDIDSTVSFVRKKGSSWVGVVGHSFSGLAIVYSKQQDFNAAALWDPTHTDAYDRPDSSKDLKDNFILVNELNAYISGKGPGYVYAKTVFDNRYPGSNEMASKFKVSTIVINASWSKEQQQYGKAYQDNISAQTERIVIPNSTHPFIEDGAAEKLFFETAKFFKRFL